MDFDKLYEVLPKYSTTWTIDDIETWLNFIGLSNFVKKFRKFFYNQRWGLHWWQYTRRVVWRWFQNIVGYRVKNTFEENYDMYFLSLIQGLLKGLKTMMCTWGNESRWILVKHLAARPVARSRPWLKIRFSRKKKECHKKNQILWKMILKNTAKCLKKLITNRQLKKEKERKIKTKKRKRSTSWSLNNVNHP